MINIKNKLDFAKEKTFFISGLGIEVMGEDIGKASYSSALQAQEEGSSEGWRLPDADECFALWSLKQQGTASIKDYYYWTSVPHFDENKAYMFKMDKPFLATRSKQDYYFIRLVRYVFDRPDMKHLKTHGVVESNNNSTIPPEVIKKINKDPMIFDWLYKDKNHKLTDPFEEFEIQTPYGDNIKIEFGEPDYWEDEGEGDWASSLSHIEDGIEYSISGFCKSFAYPEDEIGEWQDEVDIEISDPFIVLNRTLKKEPLVAARIYSYLPEEIKKEILPIDAARIYSYLPEEIKKEILPLDAARIYSYLPEEIKKEILTLFAEKGMEKDFLEMVKGSNLLKRFE